MYSGEVVNIELGISPPQTADSTISELDMAKVFSGQQPDDPPKEDDLITAVFQQIRLPEVRFAQSPTAASPNNDNENPSSPNSTSAPPNSFRSAGHASVENTPRTPTPRQEEEEEEDEPSLHLLAHRNSLEKGLARQQNVDMEDEEETTPRDGNGNTETEMEEDSRPSTGEACLDSIRSLVATIGEDTPRKTEGEDEDNEGEWNLEEGRSQGNSSQLSRSLVNSAMENAIQQQQYSATILTVNNEDDNNDEHSLSQTNDDVDEGNDTEEFVEAETRRMDDGHQPPIVPSRERSLPLRLEIDSNNEIGNRGIIIPPHRTSQLSNSNSSNSSGQQPCSPLAQQIGVGGDIHVRTPLNDPASPFPRPASTIVTAFEPEKQEMIRREIGSKGLEGIRQMVSLFQRGQSFKGDGEEEDGQKRQQQKMPRRQKSAHFQFGCQNDGHGNGTKETTPLEEENQRPKRKNTPHPFPADGNIGPEFGEEENERKHQIVAECQRPVADILQQFQRREFQHANGKSSPMAQEGGKKMHRQHSTESNGSGGGWNKTMMGGPQQSIWANGNGKIVMREPAPGSLAAIRKSLSSSQSTIYSSAPTSPGPYQQQNGQSPEMPANEQQQRNGQTTPNGGGQNSLHGKYGIQPKNVSQFYRLWGSAQAQSAGQSHCQTPNKINGNNNGGEMGTGMIMTNGNGDQQKY